MAHCGCSCTQHREGLAIREAEVERLVTELREMRQRVEALEEAARVIKATTPPDEIGDAASSVTRQHWRDRKTGLRAVVEYSSAINAFVFVQRG